MKGVTIISHPLVQHNLTRLRDKRTQPQEFRRVLSEVAALMMYEATRSFAVERVSVATPLAAARGSKLRREVVSFARPRPAPDSSATETMSRFER